MTTKKKKRTAKSIVPVKYCECGCGQPTRLSTATDGARGYIKGQPVRFVSGHQVRARTFPQPSQIFWDSVAKGNDDSCWEWQGKRAHGGYGRFYAQSKLFLAHRFSYEMHIGPIPKGLLVCHHCDNPCCCNPNHLFVGTHADNTRDRMAKGRGKRKQA